MTMDSYCWDRLGFGRKGDIVPRTILEGRQMFWKKKEAPAKSVSHQCQVPGCGLVCNDETSLKRHMSWAHPTAAGAGKQTKTAHLQQESK